MMALARNKRRLRISTPVTAEERLEMSSDFDKACIGFTAAMQTVAGWKHNYFGAAYSTRLRQAISDARVAADHMEQVLNADHLRNLRPLDSNQPEGK